MEESQDLPVYILQLDFSKIDGWAAKFPKNPEFRPTGRMCEIRREKSIKANQISAIKPKVELYLA